MVTNQRVGKTERTTGEVEISVEVRLDDEAPAYQISLATEKDEPDLGGLPTFEHLLGQIFRHGKLGGSVEARADLPHHLLEDMGMCLGWAIKEALGNREGIARFASIAVPFNGSLATVAIDLSGRGNATIDFRDMDNRSMGGMAQHLFESIAVNGAFDLYGKVETVGEFSIRSDHHKLEAFCKGLGTALYRATRVVGTDIPSTKGSL